MRELVEASRSGWIEYAEFGERFVVEAVTPARIAAALDDMTGRGMTLGPFSVGPFHMAGFVAQGRVGTPAITRRENQQVRFDVRLPVTLEAVISLGGQQLRLAATVHIRLRLRARTAEPLLVVIDVPAVREPDIDFHVQAQAVGGTMELLLDPIAAVVRREVASRVNAMLADPRARRARLFDVVAILDGGPSRPPPSHFDWISYDEFGRRFFPRIVTSERVGEVVDQLAGRVIEVGPLRTGPGRVATVVATGTVGAPQLSQRPGTDPVSFDLALPVTLNLRVKLLGVQRYRATLMIPLVLVARAAQPLLVVIDVAVPTADDIAVNLHAVGPLTRIVASAGRIRQQIAIRAVAAVRADLAAGFVRTYDVAEMIATATARKAGAVTPGTNGAHGAGDSNVSVVK